MIMIQITRRNALLTGGVNIMPQAMMIVRYKKKYIADGYDVLKVEIIKINL